MGKYQLRCLSCNKTIYDDFTHKCSVCDALLRTEYEERHLTLRENLPGIWKYISWLPVDDFFKTDTSIKTYRSLDLAKELGLKNLFITISGYFPEKGIQNLTCTFKEFEAVPTYQRLREKGKKGILLASAGNTAKSFAHMSFVTKIPAIIVIPESANILVPEPAIDTVMLIAIKGDDYTCACQLVARIKKEGFVQEGGAKNVARRDGMALVMIDAAVTMKSLPVHYFQAIGSGTGAIAAWEASLRLLQDGRFGNIKPKLHVSQNFPYTPMHNAWSRHSKEINVEIDMPNAAVNISKVKAKMLTNRNPPYSIIGGTFDALSDTKGETYAVTNRELDEAAKLFQELEGIDIASEAAVALGSLIQAIEENKVSAQDKILLNITGAGFERIKEDHDIYRLKPNFIAENEDIDLEEIPLNDL